MKKPAKKLEQQSKQAIQQLSKHWAEVAPSAAGDLPYGSHERYHVNKLCEIIGEMERLHFAVYGKPAR